MTDESSEGRIEQYAQSLIDYSRDRDAIAERVAFRTDMTVGDAKRLMMAKDLADTRNNLYNLMQAAHENGQRQQQFMSIAEKQNRMIDRMEEELGEDWRDEA